ncbi:Uncharacterized 2Fe-2 and 4Fe-4S clusters-containing protein, contains DUF4445 domain [[Clostridium] polysaccharolyticum]|uniref:Uncharacterized 2Fe-2 and 4Fe-4S clusters-containing protein, contains DUF4445 domain n=2 Tax=[Clostridium] polysaccharolyticum TaxID=29364 RepID=A0A1H9YKZ4_9FIRM|nr:Uncharacterized 2Fe-2 and 4Fe-4S clusters-containing protein, contains DUF4445 domain [[Clostridium] polysaccharolyticum]
MDAGSIRKAAKMYLTVIGEKESKETKKRLLTFEIGETVTQVLRRNGIFPAMPCGGRGTCGKCRVKVVNGHLPVTEADNRLLTKEQRKEGLRLGCKAILTENVTIQVEEEAEYEVLCNDSKTIECQKQKEDGRELAIAIDIGTTTIALQLLDMHSGETVRSLGELNRQRSYGADVVSRISACNNGAEGELRKLIRSQIADMILRMDVKALAKIVIAANTTMCHILMGYRCETLGSYPFKPVNIKTILTSSEVLFGDQVPRCPVEIIPGISTYVGADIVSGLVTCGFAKSDRVNVLIDLGTNGEMAIGNREHILVTSAAAGPAFEGGNITCGTGSVPGAISGAKIRYGIARVETIQNKNPVGICGSGVLELAAELLKNQIIDEDGTFLEKYMEKGFPVAISSTGKIVLTQKDIREIQMAKSAVYSALCLLVKRYGAELEDVDTVYLAGGFGFHVNIEKAVAIGLLPYEWKDKIVVAGNTSLQGAKEAILKKDFLQRAEAVVNVSKEISLALEKEFNQYYMVNMHFSKKQE